MQLEWDEAKRRLNLIKHGIDFKDLHETFGLPMSVTSDSRRGPTRIISARKLRKNEEEKFAKRKN